MRALVYDSAIKVHTTVPIPEPAAGQSLLRVHKAGICNTDLEIIQGYKGFHGILGHEFVAEVADGNPEWVGRRVVGEISDACGSCDYCGAGIPSQCRHRKTVGIIDHDGAFADYLALSTQNLHLVPDSVTDEQAVFVEPLAACLQIPECTLISPRYRVVVIGAGKMGMLAAQVLQRSGVDLSVVVRHEKQARILAGWGIRSVAIDEISAKSIDLVVDCTGNASGFADALNIVKPRGKIVLKSTYAGGLPQVDLTRVVVDEIHVIGSRCGPFGAALRLLAAGQIDIAPLIDARYPIEEAVTAFEYAQKPGVLKVLLEF